jgi:hypothetical protein
VVDRNICELNEPKIVFSLARNVAACDNFDTVQAFAKSYFLMSKSSLSPNPESASTGVKVLLLAVLIAGVMAGTFWYARQGTAKNTGANGGTELSGGTQAVLKNLGAPVEIRFYSVLDQASVSPDTFAFGERINQLLAAYQNAGGGKIVVKQFKTSADANAASADGLRPFNLDKGDACYLGITLISDGHKESFPQLSPEWETALESDLSRAIARLKSTGPAQSAATAAANAAGTPAPDAATIESVKKALPNLETITVAQGSQLLSVSALGDYQAAAAEMEAQVKEARQRLADAQASGSEAEQQAAMKNFQQVQAAQSEKLKEIAAKLRSQINALEQIKTSATNEVK